ncbi:diphosphate--fructose-6-phosphate 1-phosphotransferase [Sporosarcina sp. Marseille-Q4063]|uniref:diphosphate--fructose-6-phosphate 1-phosphotransferase n=1 Tax=Sporosarcina sp. Marseille-Q4063 TaxID=2810514 RepID=UPI001BAE802D|nr:diphosphate--fructose-6-phosphate 1-phosphotransferase [Sporosarcina sp. Marseille-Q4063]QUW21267.1 diphosphate--fructose-6-phosphate 1-phosphotransferase [Sporosarcina sp. Marseille-Q4063]
MKKEKILIGQSGGPTSVTNASFVSSVESAIDKYDLYGALYGFEGLLEEKLIPINEHNLNDILKFKKVPGACLGTCRYYLSDEDIEMIVDNLTKHEIRNVVFSGGNGTMLVLNKIYRVSQSRGYDLKIIGIPKTVDNDLELTDHTPGFGSAARFVALSTRDIGKDLEAMRRFEQVRVIETMGRNSGWIAASSVLARETQEDAPHLVYLPEKEFKLNDFLGEVKESVNTRGYTTVVVSEGIRNGKGELLAQKSLQNNVETSVLGGVSEFLTEKVKKELGFSSRAELLGMSQRSFQMAVSTQDYLESVKIGKKAIELIENDDVNVMISIERVADIPEYSFELNQVMLKDIVKTEKKIPENFLNEAGRPNAEFKNWLRPLAGFDISAYPRII